MKEQAGKLLEKAGRALHAAETLLHAGDPEFAVGRAYYAMLHTAQALLREKDLRYRKHSGVHSAFGQHFVKTGDMDPKFHRWLLAAFDKRLTGDYDFEVTLETETATDMVEQAREFLEAARKYLGEKA
jgi:uncharacterized protein (UPF0332 family)